MGGYRNGVIFSVSMTREMVDRIREAMGEEGQCSRSQFIREAIEAKLKVSEQRMLTPFTPGKQL